MLRRALVMIVVVLTLGAIAGPHAAGASAPIPVIGAFFADSGVEPTRFSPDEVGKLSHSAMMNNYVRSVTWSSWGGAQAVGTGQVTLIDGTLQTYGTPPADTSSVTVRLSGLRQCLGVPTYTSYSLELAPGASPPHGWPAGESGTFGCEPKRISRRRDPGCSQGLQVPKHFGKYGEADLEPTSWQPKLPGAGLTVLCDTKLQRRGEGVVVYEGIRENLTHGVVAHGREFNWPAVIVTSDPVWCPLAALGHGNYFHAIVYSKLEVTIFGPPRVPNRKTLSSFGHRGLPVTAVSRQQFTPDAACLTGISWENPMPPRTKGHTSSGDGNS